MSKAFYDIEGLRFWSHDEIVQRESFARYIEIRVGMLLKRINPAWQLHRFEAPTLIPQSLISPEHLNSGDVFSTQYGLALRAETTPSSYAIMREMIRNTNDYNAKLPLCVYQVGKSFRTEQSDGATAAKLRFNEFYQMEFQCAYSNTTKKDYFDMLPDLAHVLGSFLPDWGTAVIESDRLPSYSLKTMDIVAQQDGDQFTEFEIASISKRNDFAPDVEVFEIAIGLDRLVELANFR